MRNKIYEIILKIAKQNNEHINRISSDMILRDDLAIKSLDLAQLIAELDITFGVEPLSVIQNPRLNTVKDILDLYETPSKT